MTTYFLDSSVIIDYLRGKKITVDLVDKLEGELVSSFICLAELYEGIFRVKNSEEAKTVVLHFFSSLSTVFGLEDKIAERFGLIRKELKTQGKVIEDIDIFIASTCLSYDLALVTHNKEHFSRMRNLKIYPPLKG